MCCDDDAYFLPDGDLTDLGREEVDAILERLGIVRHSVEQAHHVFGQRGYVDRAVSMRTKERRDIRSE